MIIAEAIDIPTNEIGVVQTLLVYQEEFSGLGMGYSYGEDYYVEYSFYLTTVDRAKKPKIKEVDDQFALEVYKKLTSRRDRIQLWLVLKATGAIKTKKDKYYEEEE